MMKRFIAVFVTVLLGLLPLTAMAASAEMTDWTYNVTESGVEILGYTGTDADVVIPEEIDGQPVTHIGQNAFRDGTMRSVVVPDSVTYISKFAWKDCKNLEEIVLPYEVSYLGTYAFDGCSSLRSVVLPKGIDGLTNLFENCAQLEEVVIPYGIEYIGSYAFAHCNALSSLTIPETVSEVGHSTFGGCNALKSVTYGGSKKQWNAMTDESDILLTTRVWSTSDMNFDVKLSGPSGPLVPGQIVDVQVTCDAEIPTWANLAVELDLKGITAPTYQVVLTADKPSAVFTGTVASGAQDATVAVKAVGGRGIAGGQWQASIATSESTRYETTDIGVDSEYTSIQDFLAQYTLPEGTTISILNADGSTRDGSLPLATGNLIQFRYPDGSEQTLETVVKGDVLGTGLLGMDQLIRIARAITGTDILSTLSEAAADLNGNGHVDLNDMVALSRLFMDASVQS